jgi:hypothetical protein
LNVDFDERDANELADREAGESPLDGNDSYRNKKYQEHLNRLRQRNYERPGELLNDKTRRLRPTFLANIFGNELRGYYWHTPLKLYGFHTDQIVIDTAALKALDIRFASIGALTIKNTTFDDNLRIERTNAASINVSLVTAQSLILNNVSFGQAKSGDRKLLIDTTRIVDRISILGGQYDAIDLYHVKVDDLLIRNPDWINIADSSAPKLCITQSLNVSTFLFASEKVPQRIRLNQFLFGKAYLGPNPIPVIDAMSADANEARKASLSSKPIPVANAIDTESSEARDACKGVPSGVGATKDTRPDLEPYTLIAKSYAERGESAASDAILFAKNDQDRRTTDFGLDYAVLAFTWAVAGYGFKPQQGFYCIAISVIIGWLIFWWKSDSLAKGSYQPRNSLLLALDSVIPVIHLDKHHEDVRYEGWPQIVLYLLRILGAVLVFVALYYLQKKVLG